MKPTSIAKPFGYVAGAGRIRLAAGPGDDDDDDEVPIGDPPDDDEGDDGDEDDDDDDDDEEPLQALTANRRYCIAASPLGAYRGTMSPARRAAAFGSPIPDP